LSNTIDLVGQPVSSDIVIIGSGPAGATVGRYAWVFPKGNGYAEIGLGVISTMTKHSAQWHLDKFIKQSFFKERFKNSRILEVQGGGVPLAAPLKIQYADTFGKKLALPRKML
jgi:flavin-dependent dehydrogenase